MFCEKIKIPGLPGEGTVTDGSVDWYEMDWENVDNGMTEEQMIESYKKLAAKGNQKLRHPRLPRLQHHL